MEEFSGKKLWGDVKKQSKKSLKQIKQRAVKNDKNANAGWYGNLKKKSRKQWKIRTMQNSNNEFQKQYVNFKHSTSPLSKGVDKTFRADGIIDTSFKPGGSINKAFKTNGTIDSWFKGSGSKALNDTGSWFKDVGDNLTKRSAGKIIKDIGRDFDGMDPSAPDFDAPDLRNLDFGPANGLWGNITDMLGGLGTWLAIIGVCILVCVIIYFLIISPAMKKSTSGGARMSNTS
jgi:preprotein translocase subunit YajC